MSFICEMFVSNALKKRGFSRILTRASGVLECVKQLACVKGELACVKGELACVKGELACVKGELVCVKGELAWVKGELACVKGELACLKGELACVKGELACVTGELACVNGIFRDNRGKKRNRTHKNTKDFLSKIERLPTGSWDLIQILGSVTSKPSCT